MLFRSLPNEMSAFHEKHERFIEESKEALQKARQLNDQMKAVLEASRKENENTVSDLAEGWDIPGSVGGISADPLKKLREQEDSLIISSSDMNHMENNIFSQQSTYGQVESTVRRTLGVLNEALGIYGDQSRLMTSVLDSTQTLNTYLQSYGVGGTVIASELAFIEQHRKIGRASCRERVF